jgi:hypothetical protein
MSKWEYVSCSIEINKNRLLSEVNEDDLLSTCQNLFIHYTAFTMLFIISILEYSSIYICDFRL